MPQEAALTDAVTVHVRQARVSSSNYGRGVGRVRMPAFLAALEATGFWKRLSRALCARCGFREVGIYEPDGQRWRVADMVIVERLLGAAIL